MPAKDSTKNKNGIPYASIAAVTKKYKSGQNTIKSGLCIATHLNGKSCDKPQGAKFVPYCKDCMKTGDPSMSVEQHPKYGKMLVAARALPAHYYSALWGDVMTEHEMPDPDQEWGFETSYGDFVNPVKHPASQIQFSQCPGPNEKVTISFGDPHCLLEDCFLEKMSENKKKQLRKEKLGSFIFVTNQPVPKNHQLMMSYEDGNSKNIDAFFEEMGIVRSDIGTPKFPALLKKWSQKKKDAAKTVKKGAAPKKAKKGSAPKSKKTVKKNNTKKASYKAVSKKK